MVFLPTFVVCYINMVSRKLRIDLLLNMIFSRRCMVRQGACFARHGKAR